MRLDKCVYSKYSVLAIFRPRESDNQIVLLKLYSTEIAVNVYITNIEIFLHMLCQFDDTNVEY